MVKPSQGRHLEGEGKGKEGRGDRSREGEGQAGAWSSEGYEVAHATSAHAGLHPPATFPISKIKILQATQTPSHYDLQSQFFLLPCLLTEVLETLCPSAWHKTGPQ